MCHESTIDILGLFVYSEEAIIWEAKLAKAEQLLKQRLSEMQSEYENQLTRLRKRHEEEAKGNLERSESRLFNEMHCVVHTEAVLSDSTVMRP